MVSDCVIEDLFVNVKVDAATAAQLDAKLNASSDPAISKVFTDAQLSVKVEKVVTGTYNFKVTHPVVFERLTRKQPSKGVLGANNDFSDWNEIPQDPDPSELKNQAVALK